MNHFAVRATIILFFSLLSACGGGSDDSLPVSGTDFSDPRFGGVVNGFNAVSSTRYDELGNVNGSATYEHVAGTKTRIWTDFDELGAVRFSDVCRYNEFGREVDCESFGDTGNYEKSDSYDFENGLIIKRRRFDRNTNDVLSIVDFTYDDNRNLLQRVYSSVGDTGELSEFRRVTYTYDKSGRRESGAESFNGVITIEYAYQYNDTGQMNRIDTQFRDGTESGFQSWEYDENGNLARRVIDENLGSVTTEYQYEKSPFTVTNHMLRVLEFWL